MSQWKSGSSVVNALASGAMLLVEVQCFILAAGKEKFGAQRHFPLCHLQGTVSHPGLHPFQGNRPR